MSDARLMPSWAMDFHSVAMAVLDEGGVVTEPNQCFRAAVAELGADGAGARVARPDVMALMREEADPNGKLYTGSIIITDPSGGWGAISGNIYRLDEKLLIIAELGISAQQQRNGEIERLTRELEETKRHLGWRNQALVKAQEEIESLLRQDTLTGLVNRKSLDERVVDEIGRWERYRRPLGLVLMEMDDFGGVNESYGREVGDELLRHVATILTHSLRTTDLVARYGGLEFAVLLPETNEMGALIVAERLRMDLESQIILPMVRPLTASFGVAMLLPGESRQELYARAERAAGHSKRNGRNCVTMAGVIDECDQIYQAADKNAEGVSNA